MRLGRIARSWRPSHKTQSRILIEFKSTINNIRTLFLLLRSGSGSRSGSRAGAKSRLQFYVNGNDSSSGRRRDDVARAEVCREDDVREVRGLVELIFLS
jgi:hypothetical protein